MRLTEFSQPLQKQPQVLYHVSRKANRKSIQQQGLLPRVQEFENIKRKPGVYFMQTLDQAKDWAFWSAFDSAAAMDIWKIQLPSDYAVTPDTHPEMDIYNAWIGYEPVPAENIQVVSTQSVPKSTAQAPPFAKKVANEHVQLTELFERPLKHAPFIQWNDNEVSWFYVDDMTYVFVAQRDYGNNYIVNFKMIDSQPDEKIMQTDPYGPAAWSEIYNKMYRSKTKITGTGHQNQVIGTVIELFREFVATKKPDSITFVAFNQSRGRVLLYRRLALLAVKHLGFQFDEVDLGGVGTIWTLTKR
jgi:hypothetical protein